MLLKKSGPSLWGEGINTHTHMKSDFMLNVIDFERDKATHMVQMFSLGIDILFMILKHSSFLIDGYLGLIFSFANHNIASLASSSLQQLCYKFELYCI